MSADSEHYRTADKANLIESFRAAIFDDKPGVWPDWVYELRSIVRNHKNPGWLPELLANKARDVHNVRVNSSLNLSGPPIDDTLEVAVRIVKQWEGHDKFKVTAADKVWMNGSEEPDNVAIAKALLSSILQDSFGKIRDCLAVHGLAGHDQDPPDKATDSAPFQSIVTLRK